MCQADTIHRSRRQRKLDSGMLGLSATKGTTTNGYDCWETPEGLEKHVAAR